LKKICCHGYLACFVENGFRRLAKPLCDLLRLAAETTNGLAAVTTVD
jgi:hypothetical protein